MRRSSSPIWVSIRSSSLGLCRAGRGFVFGSRGFASRTATSAVGCRGRPCARLHEIGPATVVGVECLLLDCDRAIGDRVEQGAVVRDEQYRARERLERRLERLAALQVEVVGRLVEDEQVRARCHDDGEREPAPLAPGERGHRLLVLVPAGEEEAAQQRLRLRPLQAGHGHRAGEDTAALVQLDVVLGEVRGLDAVPDPDRSGDGLALPEHRLEQGRLAGAVRADERDVLAALEHELAPSSSCLSPAATAARSRVEHHPTRSARASGTRSRACAAGGLAARAPRLPCCAPCAAARSASASPAPAWPSTSCSGTARRSARAARCPRPPSQPSSPRGLPARPSRDAIRAMVPKRRTSGRRRARAPPSSRPPGTSGHGRRSRSRRRARRAPARATRASDIEVVGGLVEEQEIRVACEGARERGAGQLAARERGQRPVEVSVAEAEAA